MKRKYTVIALCAAITLTAAGCGKGNGIAEITPTPAPTATPTPVPATPTPMPTPTSAPRKIGVKTADAKFVSLTNSTGKVLRGIYLRTSGSEEWGENLIPTESSVKVSEEVQMYYTPSEETDAVYDLQIVISSDEAYEIYSADLSDMEKTSLLIQDDMAFLRYMSLSSKKEMNTKDNEQADVYDDSSDDENYDSNYDSDDSDYDDDGYYDPDYDNGDDNGNNSDDIGGDDTGDDNGTDDGNNGDGDGGYDDGGDDTGDGDGSYDDDGNDGGGDIVWDENGNWTEN